MKRMQRDEKNAKSIPTSYSEYRATWNHVPSNHPFHPEEGFSHSKASVDDTIEDIFIGNF